MTELLMHYWHKAWGARICSLVQRLMPHQRDDRMAALGFSIGTFISILPLFGLSILVAVLIAFAFPRVHKIALFAAIAFWNPITLIPVYIASYHLGDMLFGNAPVIEYKVALIHHAYILTRRLLVGSVIMATALSFGSYPVVRKIMRFYWKHLL